MKELKVCRICLVMDVKMYDLQSFPLETYFKPIIGINLLSTMDKEYACYECASLLKKFYHFREKCQLSQSVLYGILHTAGEITLQEIKKIDRHNLNLVSHLKMFRETEEDSFCYTFDEAKEEIKVEPHDNDEQSYVTKTGSYTTELKEEICDDYPLDAETNMSSDDDEPLSLRRSSKQEKKLDKRKVKRGRRKKVEEVEVNMDAAEPCADQMLEVTDFQSDLPSEIEALITQPKRKRGRPRKMAEKPIETRERKCRRTRNTGGVTEDDVDLEEFVTIIKLSSFRRPQTAKERREKKKITERKRRERIKANLELHNTVKAKARDRYYKSKARGVTLLASEMNIQQKRAKQLRDRQKSKLYRERKKQLANRGLQEDLVYYEDNPPIANDPLVMKKMFNL